MCQFIALRGMRYDETRNRCYWGLATFYVRIQRNIGRNQLLKGISSGSKPIFARIIFGPYGPYGTHMGPMLHGPPSAHGQPIWPIWVPYGPHMGMLAG